MALSKQLMPIYDKPMIYYPISTLMLAGIRNINIIVKPDFLNAFEKLLGDGKKWGMNFQYTEQINPNGLVEGITLSESFIDGSPIALILGDNLFHGSSLMGI